MKISKLIISNDTYTWVKHTAGLIMREPKRFSVMIVNSDCNKPLCNYPNLCEEAVYIQRAEDLCNIGMKLGIASLTNLRHVSNNLDVYKLTTQLTLQITIGDIREVYYQNNDLLNSIFANLHNVPTFSYGSSKCTKSIQLSDDEFNRKLELVEMIIGMSSKSDITGFNKTEEFYRIGDTSGE